MSFKDNNAANIHKDTDLINVTDSPMLMFLMLKGLSWTMLEFSGLLGLFLLLVTTENYKLRLNSLDVILLIKTFLLVETAALHLKH